MRAVCLHRKEAGRREVLEHVGGVRDSGSPRRHEVVGLLLELEEASPALGKADPAYTPPNDKTGVARTLFSAGGSVMEPALGAFN